MKPITLSSSLPLPKVTEISFDDLANLLPADCKIRLTLYPMEWSTQDLHQHEHGQKSLGHDPAYSYLFTA